MTLAAVAVDDVATLVVGILLGVATWWNARRAKAAEQKVEQRTQHVDTRIEEVKSKAEGAAFVATSATSLAVDAKKTADDYQRLTAIIEGIASSNDDLRSAYRDLKYELAQAQARDRQCQQQLLQIREEKRHLDSRVHDLEREVTGFAGQVAQLTEIVNRSAGH